MQGTGLVLEQDMGLIHCPLEMRGHTQPILLGLPGF